MVVVSSEMEVVDERNQGRVLILEREKQG